jgi:DNA mismatch endonuclease (patch repair protein)
MGYRYRLHRRDLPGKPDLVFGPRKKVIFVHGCFWHGHDCPLGRIPKSRVDFWETKIHTNRSRDEAHLVKLEESGWKSLVIWECQLRKVGEIENRIREFLG